MLHIKRGEILVKQMQKNKSQNLLEHSLTCEDAIWEHTTLDISRSMMGICIYCLSQTKNSLMLQRHHFETDSFLLPDHDLEFFFPGREEYSKKLK